MHSKQVHNVYRFMYHYICKLRINLISQEIPVFPAVLGNKSISHFFANPGFRGEDLNMIFYQNLPNLHNRYKSAERKISQKTQNTC
jgi:hypothetical protein